MTAEPSTIARGTLPQAVGEARVPGACGELVQGRIGSCDFLVTCPIDLYSHVTVELQGVRVSRKDRNTFVGVAPKNAWKTRLAVIETLRFLGLEGGEATVRVSSDLPVAKGMASSTADISAACWATARAAGARLSPSQVARIALSIEPSDGVMFPGITLLDHRHGRCLRSLGTGPPMSILALDLGGEVDTLLFNTRSDLDELNARKELGVAEALTTVIHGLEMCDAAMVARGATLSAVANQAIDMKPRLQEIMDLSGKCGGLGVVVAHSGTVAGIMANHRGVCNGALEAVLRMDLGMPLGVYDLVGGGTR